MEAPKPKSLDPKRWAHTCNCLAGFDASLGPCSLAFPSDSAGPKNPVKQARPPKSHFLGVLLLCLRPGSIKLCCVGEGCSLTTTGGLESGLSRLGFRVLGFRVWGLGLGF